MTKPKAKPIADEEEALVQAQIAADPDDAEATDADLAQARPFAEAFPGLMESIKRSRGRPRVAAPREAVTLRIDQGTLQRFKATGKDWRSRMSEVLAKAKL